MTATIYSLFTRKPIAAVQVVVIAEDFPDDQDRELTAARRLFIGRKALNKLTGIVGHVSAVRRVGGQLEARFWTRDPFHPLSAQRPDWIALGLLSRHWSPNGGGNAA